MTTPQAKQTAKIDAFLNAEIVTLARDYAATSEKWIFCTDILDRIDLPRADALVDYIENRLAAYNTPQKPGSTIESFPAFDVIAPTYGTVWNDKRAAFDMKAGQNFRLKIGNHWHEFAPGSIVSSALKEGNCPVAALARYEEQKEKFPYAGHKLHWLNGCATMITKEAQKKGYFIGLRFGDLVRFEGRVFQLAPASNHNVELIPADLPQRNA